MHLWFERCAVCGEMLPKMRMRPLYTSLRSSNPPRLLCYLCESCFCGLLDQLEVSDIGM